MKQWTVPALIMFLLVLFLAWFVWPTRYHYERLKLGQNEFPVRTDRITGTTEVFYPGGWIKREPSPPSPPQVDVPPWELAKLSTTARANYGLLEVQTYNGSGYRIDEMLVTISVYDAKHSPVIDHRVYRLIPSYPSGALDQRVIEENGRQALAVIIPHSENRPHFSGPAYVRKGSETIIASEEQFNELIAARNSLVAQILAHKSEIVHVINSKRGNSMFDSYWPGTPKIHDCNQHFITLESGTEPRNRLTFPISDITIGREHQNNRFQITIYR